MKIILQQKGRDSLYKIWNRIDGHMVIYMHSDGGNIVFHDKLLPIKKGTLCYIGPDIYHYTLPEIPQEYIRSKIFISQETFRKILEVVPKDSGFYRQFNEKQVIYSQLSENIMTEVEEVFLEASKADKLKLAPDFICSYFRLMTYIGKYSVENISASSDCVSKAIEYINLNYSNKISLDEICGVTYVSKHHLCRKFKATIGITVMEYILTTRIAIAKKMLATDDCSIGEISERCGFSSLAYFCQAFKTCTGMSAKQYRKNKNGF